MSRNRHHGGRHKAVTCGLTMANRLLPETAIKRSVNNGTTDG